MVKRARSRQSKAPRASNVKTAIVHHHTNAGNIDIDVYYPSKSFCTAAKGSNKSQSVRWGDLRQPTHRILNEGMQPLYDTDVILDVSLLVHS